MDSYKLEILKSVNKKKKKIDKSYIEPIFKAIQSLADNPFPPQCKKLKGSESSYRIRVGSYRIIYEIEAKNRVVTIFHIRHREDAYKRL